MKKEILALFFAISSLLFAHSCTTKGRTASGDGNDDGVVRGIKYSAPKGMDRPSNLVYVPTGAYELPIDTLESRTPSYVTVNGFWIDAYEVTNSQYHQFVNWVRDSIAALELKYFKVSKAGDTTIDWSRAQKINYQDPAIQERLSRLFLPEDRRLNGRAEFNTNAFIYRIKGYDFGKAIKNSKKSRKDFYYEYTVPIYPDTLVWINDFSYSYNEPMVKYYFSHPRYMRYPVVGVSQLQAMAYAHWRTQYLNQYLRKRNLAVEVAYRLPTEAEFQLAASGGNKGWNYPWGNYLKNKAGCMMANFKNGKGNYAEDGALYPARVDSYFPNDYGIYNIVGNVAEWTSTNYVEDPNAFQHDFNPSISFNTFETDKKQLQRIVVKGGSWKDPADKIKIATRSYEYAESARSYVGFRCVLDLPPGITLK